LRSAFLVPAVLATAFLAPACGFARSTENRPLDASALEGLRPGESSAADVVNVLGAPVDVVQLGKRSAYRYQFTASKRTVLFLVVLGIYNQDTRADRVWVFFDENQVLSHVGATFQGGDTEYAMPWHDVEP
jgi:outer membrane protein assembly factor BamE (lipoprotein component of BamABCDE complex)